MKTETITGPAHWACYFINGDATGFDYDPETSDAEQAAADEWLKRNGVLNVMDAGEEYFTWHYGVYDPCSSAKGGTVCDYTCEVEA
jgi:hypothetical protein